MECTGEYPQNSCGGCDTLEHEYGAACGECGTGAYICDGENATVCVGGEPNEQGGCGELEDLFEVRGQVIMANNFGNQLDDMYKPYLTASSTMNRVSIFARFCHDPECEEVAFVLPGTIGGQEFGERYSLGTASLSGGGFSQEFVIPDVPEGGDWYFQLIGDPERRELAGMGNCMDDLEDCPGTLNILQADHFQITGTRTDERGRTNPGAGTTAIFLDEDFPVAEIDDTIYLGHIVLPRSIVVPEMEGGSGRFIVGASNQDDTDRNTIYLYDLSLRDNDIEPVKATTLTWEGEDYDGTICGAIQHEDTIYVMASSQWDVGIFELDAETLEQRGDEPIADIEVDLGSDDDHPWPCSGTYAEVDGNGFLILAQKFGAGSDPDSGSWPIYLVNLDEDIDPWDRITYHFEEELGEAAVRSVVFDHYTNTAFFYDMNWSKNAEDLGASNRIFHAPLNADGTFGALQSFQTQTFANEGCGGALTYPSFLGYAEFEGAGILLAGHDDGVKAYWADDLTVAGQIDLQQYGSLYTHFAQNSAGEIYALSMCKSATHKFQIEHAGPGTVDTNRHMMPVLQFRVQRRQLRFEVVQTGFDTDEDGTPDHAIDIGFFDLKRYIRSYGGGMPLPPIAYTGPSMALAGDFVVMRGSGIQGGGGAAVSSSGLGQVGDVGVFDTRTGHGVLFRDYIPFFDGASGRWGVSMLEGRDASTGFVLGIE